MRRVGRHQQGGEAGQQQRPPAMAGGGEDQQGKGDRGRQRPGPWRGDPAQASHHGHDRSRSRRSICHRGMTTWTRWGAARTWGGSWGPVQCARGRARPASGRRAPGARPGAVATGRVGQLQPLSGVDRPHGQAGNGGSTRRTRVWWLVATASAARAAAAATWAATRRRVTGRGGRAGRCRPMTALGEGRPSPGQVLRRRRQQSRQAHEHEPHQELAASRFEPEVQEPNGRPAQDTSAHLVACHRGQGRAGRWRGPFRRRPRSAGRRRTRRPAGSG
jgi:hypothetical protein